MTPGVPPVRFGDELRRVSASLIKFCNQQNSLQIAQVETVMNGFKMLIHLESKFLLGRNKCKKQYLYLKDTCLLNI